MVSGLDKAALRYQAWARDITREYSQFHLQGDTRDLADRISGHPIALILGAGMSTVSSKFQEEWSQYSRRARRNASRDARFWQQVNDIFLFGGIYATPREGFGLLPDLVRMGHIPLMLVFNYDSQVELCLHLCGVGYESRTCRSDGRIERITVGTAETMILKPHGSYHLSGGNTGVVLPDDSPTNEALLEHFVNTLQLQRIGHVLIIGYSGNHDAYVESYLRAIKSKGVGILHVSHVHDRNDPDDLATHRWGILDRAPYFLRNGGNDALYALAHRLKIRKLCWQNGDIVTRLQNNLRSADLTPMIM